MYICQNRCSIDILPQAKEERGLETEGERGVTLQAEWQWPSCIASLKRREGGGWGGGKGRVNVTFKCLLATLP